jgi:hypothetical protein
MVNICAQHMDESLSGIKYESDLVQSGSGWYQAIKVEEKFLWTKPIIKCDEISNLLCDIP